MVLTIVGLRILRPIAETLQAAGTIRRKNRLILVAASAALGLFSGLLANGGGFLLVPMYLLIFGLDMRQAVGTSLLVIFVLSLRFSLSTLPSGTSTGLSPVHSRSVLSQRAP